MTRQVEAIRSLHRAAQALRNVPGAKAALDQQMAALPDVADVGQVLDALARVRIAVECEPGLSRDPRRLALSYLDALQKKIAA